MRLPCPGSGYLWSTGGKPYLLATNQQGRVLSCHLPWTNESVYWDAGNDSVGNYDRISKHAQ
ncbi:MAG: hypothetical protein ISS77_02595 [Phycisphaerae bacterium]|nr:hypothetical protein [Phycisphaerae bacterium]